MISSRLMLAAGLLMGLACGRTAAVEPLLQMTNLNGPYVTEERHFLRLVADPGKLVSTYNEVSVSGLKALQLTYEIRITDVQRGEKPWYDARIMLKFKNAAGEEVHPAPPPPFYVGTTNGWRTEMLQFAVPATATTFSVMPALFQAIKGTMDLDHLTLVAIDPATLPPIPVAANGEQVVAVDGGKAVPPALHAVGNRLCTAAGQEVWLQGVAVPSLEWSNSGDAVLASMVAAIDTWKANIIRLPVMDERWFGKKDQTDNGVAYRALIAQAVQAAASRGAYLIIDLHRYRAPTDDAVVFWKAVAEIYKDHPAVLFGVLNEPHDISWQQWRDGGVITDTVKKSDALSENKEVVSSFHSPGMQGLVAAIRSTGAKNLIVAGGLDWSYDLSGVQNGFALDDLGGQGIVYDAHVHPWKSDWQHKFLDVAATYPVLLGEVGCDKTRYDFIPPERFENPYTWAPDMLACIQGHKLHWTAWAFHPHCGPPMLLDTKDFTPTPFWGAFVRAALLGGRYQAGRLR